MIHFISSGRGWLVFAITFGVSLIGNILTDLFLGTGFYDTHKWPLALSLAALGAICWRVGLHLNRGEGRSLLQKSKHTFFFIPVQIWGPILIALALVADVADMLKK